MSGCNYQLVKKMLTKLQKAIITRKVLLQQTQTRLLSSKEVLSDGEKTGLTSGSSGEASQSEDFSGESAVEFDQNNREESNDSSPESSEVTDSIPLDYRSMIRTNEEEVHSLGNALYDEMIDEREFVDPEMYIQETMMTDKIFNRWKKAQLDHLTENTMRLKQYRSANQLLGFIRSRLEEKDQQYFAARLKYGDSPYSEALAQNMENYDNQKLLVNMKDKAVEKVKRDEQWENDYNVNDSVKRDAQFIKDNFVPSNNIDQSPYQLERYAGKMSWAQYVQVSEQQLQDEEWRKIYDEPHQITPSSETIQLMDDYHEALKYGFTDEEEELEWFDGLAESLELDRLKALGIDLRVQDPGNEDQYLRTMHDDVNRFKNIQESSYVMDRPSQDLGRDNNYELARQMRRGVVYDSEAAQNSEWHRVGIIQDGDNTSLKKFNQIQQMKPLTEIPQDFNGEEEEGGKLDFYNLEQENLKLLQDYAREMKDKVSHNFNICQLLYKNVMDHRKQLIEATRKRVMKKMEHQALPKRKFNFLDNEVHVQRDSEKIARAQKKKVLQQQFSTHKFSEQSDGKTHERELLLISKLAAIDDFSAEYRSRYEFVFENMRSKNLKKSVDFNSRLFEYAVLSNNLKLANSVIRDLSKEVSGSCPIDPQFLQRFYENSLKKDNFDGVAYLTNYCENHSVDVTQWNLSSFHSALDYYLNVNFNISKLMIFTKFYTLFYTQSARTVLQGENRLSEQSSAKAAEAIFGKHDGLVDMNRLFSFIVDHTGREKLIDPITKEDAVWKLIDFFTQDKTLFGITKKSEHNSIDEAQIAKFLSNHFDDPQSLERAFLISQRLSGTAYGKTFENGMLSHLREFQSKNQGRLPRGFNRQQVKNLYLNMKASGRLNLHSSELLLFTLKSLKLNEEVIDYCETSKVKGAVRQYYMSEALLQMKPNKKSSYKKLLEKAEVLPTNDSTDLTACQLTQATKAVMLDKGGAEGYRFFNDKAETLRKQNTAREDLLVNLYDSVFGDRASMSIDDFRKTYLRSSLVATRVAKESMAVNQIKRVIEGKDFEEIENLFSLYQALREEKHLEGTSDHERLNEVRQRRKQLQVQVGREDFEALYQLHEIMQNSSLEVLNSGVQTLIEDAMKAFCGVELSDLKEMNNRHEQLVSLSQFFSESEKQEVSKKTQVVTQQEATQDLTQINQSKHSGLDPFESEALEEEDPFAQQTQMLKEEQKEKRRRAREEKLLLKVQKKADAEMAQKKETERILRMDASEIMQEQQDEVLQTPMVDDDIDPFEDEFLEELSSEDELDQEHDGMPLSVSGINWPEGMSTDEEFGQPKYQLHKPEERQKLFQDFKDIYQKEIEARALTQFDTVGKNDPIEIDSASQEQEARAQSNAVYNEKSNEPSIQEGDDDQVKDYNEELLETPLDSERDINDPEIIVADVYNTTMQEMKTQLLEALTYRKKEVLPIALKLFNKLQEKTIGQTKQIRKYNPEKIDDTLDKLGYVLNHASSPLISAFVDLEKLMEQEFERKEESLFEEVDCKTVLDAADINYVRKQVEQLQSIDKEVIKALTALSQIKEKIINCKMDVQSGQYDSEPSMMDANFRAKHDQLVNTLYSQFQQLSDQATRTQKVTFMQDVLQLHLGENFTATTLPSFYAHDLITFGLQNKVPEAIRLGEKLVAEQDAQLPSHIAAAVNEYMLDGGNQKQYRESMNVTGPLSAAHIYQQQHRQAGIVSSDDPYWKEFMAKNSQREDIWRTPSMYAWTYKPYGLIGEVVDMERIRQKYEQSLSKGKRSYL